MIVHVLLNLLDELWKKMIHEAVPSIVSVSPNVFKNLLDELWKKMICEAVPSIVWVSPNVFNKFNNTGARMQDSIYRMPLKSRLISDFCTKTSIFRH